MVFVIGLLSSLAGFSAFLAESKNTFWILLKSLASTDSLFVNLGVAADPSETSSLKFAVLLLLALTSLALLILEERISLEDDPSPVVRFISIGDGTFFYC